MESGEASWGSGRGANRLAIVAGGRLVWGLRRSRPPSRWWARAKTFFSCALAPRSPWKHPSHQESPGLFLNWAFAVSPHTQPPLHRQNLSLFMCAVRAWHRSEFHSYVSLAERLIARRTPTATAVAGCGGESGCSVRCAGDGGHGTVSYSSPKQENTATKPSCENAGNGLCANRTLRVSSPTLWGKVVIGFAAKWFFFIFKDSLRKVTLPFYQEGYLNTTRFCFFLLCWCWFFIPEVSSWCSYSLIKMHLPKDNVSNRYSVVPLEYHSGS